MTLRHRLFLFAAFSLALAARQSDAQAFDLVIRNARVVDGMGNPWYRADVGIRGDRIAEIGALGSRQATRTIDARGRVLAPGFVDMMAGTSEPLVTDPVTGESKLRQGITTMMVGEGDSEAPQDERTIGNGMTIDGQKITWRTFDEYFRILERKGLPLNVVHNVGAAQIRRIVIGEEDKRPTPAQLEQMKSMV
jgi:N-acyl-D-aspartate/D-glutamate deacylase